jgi:hypothetical protein
VLNNHSNYRTSDGRVRADMPVDRQDQYSRPGVELPGSLTGQALDQHGWRGEKGVSSRPERVNRHARH